MRDFSREFDILAERADDCGAIWAERLWRRCVRSGAVPADWPGTLEEARHLVETFAARTGYAEREGLANIVWYAAESTWSESLQSMRSTRARARGEGRRAAIDRG